MRIDLICDVCGDSEYFRGKNLDIIDAKLEKEGWHRFKKNNRYTFWEDGSYQGYCPKHREIGTTNLEFCVKPIDEPCPDERCMEIRIDSDGKQEYECKYYMDNERVKL